MNKIIKLDTKPFQVILVTLVVFFIFMPIMTSIIVSFEHTPPAEPPYTNDPFSGFFNGSNIALYFSALGLSDSFP